MRDEQVSGFQVFSVIFLFELGSALLVGLADDAMQDAWLTVLFATVFGIVLYLVYAKLSNMYPTMTLISYLQHLLGKQVGWIIGLMYVVYFIYIASRVLRDFEELLVITAYRSSSLLAIGIIMVICVMYAAYQGLEVFLRISELCFFIMVLMLLTLVILEVASGVVKLNHFRPFLENGWGPVLKSLFPGTITFPFGELVTLTMLLPFLNKQECAKSVGIKAIVLSGFFLSLFSAMNIAVTGANVAKRSAFPILTTVSYIDIASFVQRLDTLVIISMVILGFVKVTVFFFCSLIGVAKLFQVEERNQLIYPLGIIVLVSSILMAPNYILHIHEGLEIVPYYLHLPFQIIIPIFLMIIGWLKQKRNTNPW